MKLIVKELTKKFGDKVILNSLNMEFKRGNIYGILGRNGSGKTTFFNVLDNNYNDLLGEYYLVDNNQKVLLNNTNFGYVSSEALIPEFLTGYEFIKFFMEINNIDEKNTIDEYFKLINLSAEDGHKLIKNYSLGMKSKIQILMYIILKPELLVLDEPLTSLDIIVAKEIKDLLKKIKKDCIIIFSTHILELAQSMCDELIILNNGKFELIDKKIIKNKDFENKIVEFLKDEQENN